MDHDLLRERLLKAVGNLPDAAHVTVAVRDLRAAIIAIENRADAAGQLAKANSLTDTAYADGRAEGYTEGHADGYLDGRRDGYAERDAEMQGALT